MALVVKSFKVSGTPGEGGCYAEITARESGLISWIFALLQLDPTWSLKILFDKVVYESNSITGFRRVILPIHSVSSVYFGTSKPWKLALTVFILFIGAAYVAAEVGSVFWTMLLVLLGVAAAALIFILKRELCIGVTENTGDDYELLLKRSVIENQEITEDRLAEIATLFTAILDAHKSVLAGRAIGQGDR